MPRYARMLVNGMQERNHSVEIWTAGKLFYRLPIPRKKWLAYIDQFIVFPLKLKKRLRKCSNDTLFVFTDHALGPWVPNVAHRPHIIHCHDFLAQRSEQEELEENTLRFSGKLYQRWIRNGYKKGQNFISISHQTREDLHRFLQPAPRISEVVYNGLNQDFRPGDANLARQNLEKKYKVNLGEGFVLHVGGNQFYKNRMGVIRIYNAWRKMNGKTLPLIMIGARPSEDLISLKKESDFSSEIHFLTEVSDEDIKLAYQAASVLLFPSLEEGFGWPIAEAMASGCLVITTKKAPMTEVGKNSCFYIPRMPGIPEKQEAWAKKSAAVLNQVINLSRKKRNEMIESSLENAKRFNTQKSIEKIEAVYKKILKVTSNENFTCNSLYEPCDRRPLPGN